MTNFGVTTNALEQYDEEFIERVEKWLAGTVEAYHKRLLKGHGVVVESSSCERNGVIRYSKKKVLTRDRKNTGWSLPMSLVRCFDRDLERGDTDVVIILIDQVTGKTDTVDYEYFRSPRNGRECCGRVEKDGRRHGDFWLWDGILGKPVHEWRVVS